MMAHEERDRLVRADFAVNADLLAGVVSDVEQRPVWIDDRRGKPIQGARRAPEIFVDDLVFPYRMRERTEREPVYQIVAFGVDRLE